ncbi:hypothetical protein WM11_21575 [Burkholderia ubonensis]|uniref:phage baseplate protein n=1 Tax=Burkholderia ubonensis TaxID=101571 RepID=UPI0007540136|nr:hypothetical protein [Burkholderia ubonensis]KWI89557.1 hypothetical protein WM10_17480 [Burkholderia ubonensis]KWI99203.1 hypothetical protein WM11_21575 [Burkholderia ubonensis]KWK03249.1 hypothetical protein WM12_27855 [Burkholderia ubonensis]KWK44214.1 hypothetical protein WM14_11695 [Burkholderia ubonensis]KWK46280.1 hypothetical protein WM13_06265 [Burkholderia ubonensis]
MPLPNLTVPTFPNVPNLPGVPPLIRAPGESLGSFAVSTIVTDAIGLLEGLLAPVWGIFDEFGAPLAVADTALSVEYRGDSRISKYPQEQGGFADYNKVQMPYNARVQLVCGGSDARRTAFLSSIEAAKQSTMLFTVITPDATYENANVVAYDYRRTSKNGVTMVVAELYLEEVRQTVIAQFKKTKDPIASDPITVGQVQAQPPSAGQAAVYGPVSVTPGSVTADNQYGFHGVQ